MSISFFCEVCLGKWRRAAKEDNKPLGWWEPAIKGPSEILIL